MNTQDFINKYLPAAKEAASGTAILPEIITAAAMLESGHGESKLAKNYNNFFGIKAGGSWQGKTIDFRTKEYTGTPNEQTIIASFRAYDTPKDSFLDYVHLLTNAKRYNNVLSAGTIEEQAHEIHKAGYSTARNYAQKLTALANTIKAGAIQNKNVILPILAIFAATIIFLRK